MKRSIHLQDLSKDHHHGLLLGWKIRQGLKAGASTEIIKDYIAYFFREALKPHFREEEDIVLSFLAEDNELRIRTLEEHASIEYLVSTISEFGKSEDLTALADILDLHIRFEERILFPYLEHYLSETELLDLGSKLKNNHGIFVDNFHNEFWKN